MNEIAQKNIDFIDIYNRSYRLTAAVFMISNVMDQNEELRTRIKKLSLRLVSMSVNLKDINFSDARKLIADIEKNSLELISMLDIASVSGLISEMNGGILKEEFQSFMSELGKFSKRFEDEKNLSVRSIFMEPSVVGINNNLEKINTRLGSKSSGAYGNEKNGLVTNGGRSSNGHKRKDLRKNMILDFIKGHNNVNIKDIVLNITGCSEKTIQRELIVLIREGKIRKSGERRWSRYSIIG